MSSAAVTVWRGLGHPPRRPQLCVWMAMYPGGGPRDWTLASLTGPRGSPGPQTPGSQPACDTGRQRLSARLLWRLSGDFTDSDSDDFEEAEGRYFRVRWGHCWGGRRGGGGSCPHPGLSSSSSASSRAAPTSFSSSAACSAQC